MFTIRLSLYYEAWLRQIIRQYTNKLIHMLNLWNAAARQIRSQAIEIQIVSQIRFFNDRNRFLERTDKCRKITIGDNIKFSQ